MKPKFDLFTGKMTMHQHDVSEIKNLNVNLLYSQYYGIRLQYGATSPTLTRIGNADLHKAIGGLPIQKKMRRCVVNAAREVVYYLHPNNSLLKENGAAADLTGTDGNVMVEVPEHYRREWFETVGSAIYQNYVVSQYALPGFTKVEKNYISAFEAAINRTTLKAASVINNTATYRGGNNNAAWDAANNSLLGKPVTNLTRANERLYAGNIGAGWCEEPFEFFSPWRWLIYIEFATLQLQQAVNNTLTAEGYRQGGLGNGITDAVSAEWNTFNAYNPFANCGLTASLGNNSGEVSFTVTDFGGAGVNRTFKANSYRGIENPYGHIWKRVDGINIQRTGGKVIAYGKAGTGPFSDDTATGYTQIAELPYTSGYILNVIWNNGLILPANIGGGSTTAFCDYYEAPASDGWRAPLFSASANSGASAGPAYVSASYTASTASAYFGFRLCCKP